MSSLKNEIEELALNDPTIRAYFTLGEKSNIPYEEILEMLVINLHSEKKMYIDQTVKLLMNKPPNSLIYKEQTKNDTQQLKAKISHLVKMARLPKDRILRVKKEGLLNELEKLSAD